VLAEIVKGLERSPARAKFTAGDVIAALEDVAHEIRKRPIETVDLSKFPLTFPERAKHDHSGHFDCPHPDCRQVDPDPRKVVEAALDLLNELPADKAWSTAENNLSAALADYEAKAAEEAKGERNVD
jgi:hypothetical protein